MDYVEQPNSNLVCCICHAPFTNPTTAQTCLHTFCYDCITIAVKHSPQCPIDRSPLSLNDLSPANPIVKHLVDELIIECPNRVSGCTQTFQRQLSSIHLKDTCQYVNIPCSEEQCDKMILRKDVGKHKDACVCRSTQCEGCGMTIKYSDLTTHNLECSSKSATCGFCFEEFPRSQVQIHAASCLDYEIPCMHANNGCPWIGPRHQLSDGHIRSCPYEAINGFFSINSAQMSALSTENAALKQKIQALESVVQTMRREMQTFRSVLGPWFQSDIQGQASSITAPPINAFDQLTLSVTPAPSSSRNTAPILPSADRGELIFPTGHHHEVDALALYFPLAPEQHTFPESHNHPRSHRSLSGGIVDPQMFQRALPLTPVAPLNLSTSLEGSLGGLRDSIATVSASVDSLARRNDIALTTESMRINEELGSLKYAVHGIRLQLHRLMMDRNAQVTGRLGEPPPLLPGQPVLHPPVMMPPFPGTPGTKL